MFRVFYKDKSQATFLHIEDLSDYEDVERIEHFTPTNSEYVKAYLKSNPEKQRLYAKRWKEKHPEKYKENRRRIYERSKLKGLREYVERRKSSD